MFPLLSVFLALLIGLTYPVVVPSSPPPDVPGAVLLIVLGALLSHLFMRSAARRAAAGEGSAGPAVRQAAMLVRTSTILTYGLVAYVAHWPAIVPRLRIEDWVLLDELLVVLPFLVSLLLSFVATWFAERKLGLHEFGLPAYLSFQGKQILLPLAPVAFFIFLRDLAEYGSRSGIRWAAEARITYLAYPFVQWITLATVLLALYLLLPFLLRWMWGARPLPDGPLRRRLLDFSKQERFKAREILVWPTGGNVLNAAVVGPTGPFRYILLTDALIEALPEEEVLAVFAHEVGHAKHRHLPLYFLFTLAFALLAFLIGNLLERWVTAGPADAARIYLMVWGGAFLLWFGTIFGFLSRRFEQQADVYGILAMNRTVEAAEGKHPFISALGSLSRQMGDIREAKGLRHFSLGRRIDFLERFLSDPATRRRHRRGIAALLGFFFALILALGGAAAATVPQQIDEGKISTRLLRADWLSDRGEPEAAVAEALEALRVARERGLPDFLGLLAGAEEPRERAMRLLDVCRTFDEAPPPWIPPASRSRTPRWYRALLLTRLAAACRTLGRSAMARDALCLALREGGDHPLILADLAEVLLEEGRPIGARLALADASRLARPDGPLHRRIRDLLGSTGP